MKLITGLKIGDIMAVTYNHEGDLRIKLEFPSGDAYDLTMLDARPTFRNSIGVKEANDNRGHYPANNKSIDTAINAINIGLALVAGVHLQFKGWCDIGTWTVIERIYGFDDEHGNTNWWTTGPRDPAESSSGNVYELTPAEDEDGVFHLAFWGTEPLNDECDIVGMLYEITALEQ